MDVIFPNKSKLYYFELDKKDLMNEKLNTELEERSRMITIKKSNEEGIVKTCIWASDILNLIVIIIERSMTQYLATNTLKSNWRLNAEKIELKHMHMLCRNNYPKYSFVNKRLWVQYNFTSLINIAIKSSN